VLRQLIRQLVGQLEPRQAGIQRLECRFYALSQTPLCLAVGAVRPRSSAEQIWDLLRLQLERRALPEEVLRVQIEAVSTAPLESRQQALFGDLQKQDHHRELELLLDRLSNRLGEQAVLSSQEWPDHQPECACRFEPVNAAPPLPVARAKKTSRGRAPAGAANVAAAPAPPAASRPIFLKPQPAPVDVVSVVPLGPPLRFRWAGNDHVVARSWGPERIETGWWRAPHVRRDYYRVETTTGRRFWLFRSVEQGAWFLHGIFG
jgi:protein ImuB